MQYRLMSDTFNTTPANWQGVDEEPTVGSDNLVKSGGVFPFVADMSRNVSISIQENTDVVAIPFKANDKGINISLSKGVPNGLIVSLIKTDITIHQQVIYSGSIPIIIGECIDEIRISPVSTNPALDLKIQGIDTIGRDIDDLEEITENLPDTYLKVSKNGNKLGDKTLFTILSGDTSNNIVTFCAEAGSSVHITYSSFPNYGMNVVVLKSDNTEESLGTKYSSFDYVASSDIKGFKFRGLSSSHTGISLEIYLNNNIPERISNNEEDISLIQSEIGEKKSYSVEASDTTTHTVDFIAKQGATIAVQYSMWPNYGTTFSLKNADGTITNLGSKYSSFEQELEKNIVGINFYVSGNQHPEVTIQFYLLNNIKDRLESLDERCESNEERITELENRSPYSLKYDADVNLIIFYGQSLSVGGSVPVSSNDFHKMLTFKCLNKNGNFVGGSNEWANDVDIDDSESVSQYYGTDFYLIEDKAEQIISHAAPISSAALTWMNRLMVENDVNLDTFDYQFIMSSPGLSGASIEMIRKNTAYYNRLLFSVQKAKLYANKLGKSFAVPCVFWAQGEGNTFREPIPGSQTEQIYYNDLKQLAADLNTDIKLITGQSKDVAVITYQQSPIIGVTPEGESEQYNYSGPSWAQVRLARETDNNIYMGGAMYQFEYADKWHPTDRVVVGLQAGINAKKLINEGKTPVVFYPKSHWVQEDTVNSRYILNVEFDVPCPPMRFYYVDDDLHNCNGLQTNYGFTLKNSQNQSIIYSTPEIRRGNVLQIVCTENPTGAKLSYAINGHYGGGNLCDSQNITVNISNHNYTIDNFAVAFMDYVI